MAVAAQTHSMREVEVEVEVQTHYHLMEEGEEVAAVASREAEVVGGHSSGPDVLFEMINQDDPDTNVGVSGQNGTGEDRESRYVVSSALNERGWLECYSVLARWMYYLFCFAFGKDRKNSNSRDPYNTRTPQDNTLQITSMADLLPGHHYLSAMKVSTVTRYFIN